MDLNLFEKINEQEYPEDTLSTKIEHEIYDLVAAMKGEYWFHGDIIYSEYDVINWLKENKPEFYKRVLEQPETIEGNDNLIEALKALGLMKEI